MRGKEWSGRELMAGRWKAFESLIDGVVLSEPDHIIESELT